MFNKYSAILTARHKSTFLRIIVVVLLLNTHAVQCYAQVATPAETEAAIAGTTPAETAAAPAASLKESAMKSLTYQTIIAAINMTFLTATTGNVVESGILTGALMATTFAMYTINNYAWDFFYPPPPLPTDGSIDLVKSTERATLKFITYKVTTWPVVTSSVYFFTGSAATAIAFGTGISLLKTATFYVNSYAWDYYDSRKQAQISP